MGWEYGRRGVYSLQSIFFLIVPKSFLKLCLAQWKCFFSMWTVIYLSADKAPRNTGLSSLYSPTELEQFCCLNLGLPWVLGLTAQLSIPGCSPRFRTRVTWEKEASRIMVENHLTSALWIEKKYLSKIIDLLINTQIKIWERLSLRSLVSLMLVEILMSSPKFAFQNSSVYMGCNSLDALNRNTPRVEVGESLSLPRSVSS